MLPDPQNATVPSLAVPAELVRAKTEEEATARTALLAGWDGAIRGVLLIADTVKPTSAEAVEQQADLRRGGRAAGGVGIAADSVDR